MNYICPYCYKRYRSPGQCQHGTASVILKRYHAVPSTRPAIKDNASNKPVSNIYQE